MIGSTLKKMTLRALTRFDEMAARRPLFIGNEIFRVSQHAPGHPLAIPRVSLSTDLCRALGWLPSSVYIEGPQATEDELTRYHEPDYVAAVVSAERRQAIPDQAQRRFNLGINGNPVYPEMFRRPATACGASLLAARLLKSPGQVYNPAGGTHHGQPSRASGFCTFNDPVLAILEMLDGGTERVFYLDLDAHFGDGVQHAFADDDRVFTLSIHESGRWPMGRGDGPTAAPGGVHDRAGGAARNIPVPQGFNDSELAFLTEAVALPLVENFEPQALVVQCGADALADDPMSKLTLSNLALWRAIDRVRELTPRLLVLGGGGYNPWAVGRCWAGVWATLNGFPVPDRLPLDAEDLMRAVRWTHRCGRNPPERWFTTLADEASPGPIRQEVRALAAAVMAP
jgi:acetoin utilization protein AcuC